MQAEPSASAGSSTLHTTAARILAIDDSPSVIYHVRRVLEGVGYRVETLSRLIEVPDRVRNDPPDLILLDLHMPALPGVSLGGFVRRYQSREIPIVIYSSRPLNELEEAASQIRAAAVVEKGSPDTRLMAAVARALRDSRAADRQS